MARWRWLLVAATTIAVAVLLAGSTGGRAASALDTSSPTVHAAHEHVAVLHPVATVHVARPARAATRPLVLVLLLGVLGGLAVAAVGRAGGDAAAATSVAVGGRRHQRGPPLLA
jgi:hypothetical protein